MKNVKVLWLSRHPLQAEQIADFADASGHELDSLAVETRNLTYPARSSEAVDAIELTAGGFDCVLGVFPAHIAGEIVRRSAWPVACSYWVPVSVPQFAEDGAPRGFSHSHWESLSF